jgi:hypothetical protein
MILLPGTIVILDELPPLSMVAPIGPGLENVLWIHHYFSTLS